MSFGPRRNVGTDNQWKFKRFRRSSRINELFLFAEKSIQRFDESRFQDREMKRSASSSEDREFVVIVMWGTFGVVKQMLTDGGFVKFSETGVLTRAGKALTKVEIFLKNSWKCVDCSNFFPKTCLTNHYFSCDPHFVILAWVQSWIIFEILMKVCSPPEFFHKSMSHEKSPFMWSTFRHSSMGTKLKYVWRTYETVQSAWIFSQIHVSRKITFHLIHISRFWPGYKV